MGIEHSRFTSCFQPGTEANDQTLCMCVWEWDGVGRRTGRDELVRGR